MLLAIFKLSGYTPFSITLTLSGIAGFILSIGMAVDANVLIFERTREELAYGRMFSKLSMKGSAVLGQVFVMVIIPRLSLRSFLLVWVLGL